MMEKELHETLFVKIMVPVHFVQPPLPRLTYNSLKTRYVH